MKLSERLYDNLVTKVNFKLSKVNNINTTGFILKTKYDTDKLDLGKKINDSDKKKYLMLVDLLKKQIIMLKILK